MYRVSTNLQQKSWDNQLRMESMTADIYSDFEGTFADNKERLPSGIIGVSNLGAGKHSEVIGILKNLSGAGVTGRTNQIGNEVDQETKDIEVFSNDVSQAVNTEKYGIDAHDKKSYNFLGKVNPQLSLWHKEIMGKYIREALLERYSINLTVAPISKTKRWNENILVTGVTLSTQPSYSPVNATYEEALGDAITTMASNAWDVNLLGAIEYWVTSVKKLVSYNGRYVVSVPSNQAILLKDPSSSAAMAGLFKDSNIYEAGNNAYRRYLGSFGKLDLFEDTRAPLVYRTGSDGSWNLTGYYKGAGDDDDRDGLSGGTAVDVGFVHGNVAAIKSQHEKLHFETEEQNYGKVVGVGAFAGYGINRTVFEDDTTDTSPINQNSAAIFTARNSITA